MLIILTNIHLGLASGCSAVVAYDLSLVNLDVANVGFPLIRVAIDLNKLCKGSIKIDKRSCLCNTQYEQSNLTREWTYRRPECHDMQDCKNKWKAIEIAVRGRLWKSLVQLSAH